MNRSTLQWKNYTFEASLSNEGSDGWLDLAISNSETSQSVCSRVLHLVDAKVWRRELLKFKDEEIGSVNIFKLGSDFSIELIRKKDFVSCSINLNPDPLLENYSETIELSADDIDEIIQFVERFIREYEILIS